MTLFSHDFTAMGSQCNIQLYCDSPVVFEQAKLSCLAEMERLEAKYSRYRPDSLLSSINLNAGIAPVTVDAETIQLMQYAKVAFCESDGLFDITSGVLRKVWDFKNKVIPPHERITETQKLVGFDRVDWSSNHVYLPETGMEIDFGGIVKEYAADSLAAILKQQNLHHGLVNLAGDIHVLGSRPDGSPWPIGISHPAHPERPIAEIPMTSGGLASSGDYQRCFDLDGKRYCHILNPKTGWPIEGLAAVSVWAEQCVVAGTLATIAMLKGEQDGNAWLLDTGAPFLTINQAFEIQYQSDDEPLSSVLQ